MKTVTLDSTQGFHSAIEELKEVSRNTIFRGLSDSNYTLIPLIGRVNSYSSSLTRKVVEKRLFVKFKESAIAFLSCTPNNDFEWLALAQHHGIPTRLMDWTYNPLVALFFAVEKERTYDSCIYVTWHNVQLKSSERNPFQIHRVYRYRPPYITPRVISQASVFTVHPEIDIPFESKNMMKIIIPNRLRREFKQMLYKYGISNKVIYPGLDGICKDLRWLETDEY